MRALSPEDFKSLWENNEDVIVLDCRSTDAFAAGHIPGAFSIPSNETFETWVTTLVPSGRDILLVCDGSPGQIPARIEQTGRPSPQGWLEGGFEAWRAENEPFHLVIRVEADELAMDLPYDERLLVVDVRTEAEFAEGHVRDAMNIPMRSLSDPLSISLLEEEQHLYICGPTDERSIMAASILLHQGFMLLRTVDGGWDSIRSEKRIPVEKEKNRLN